MSGLTTADRRDTSQLHGMRQPPSSSSSHWTKPPIPLETPHNTSRSHVSGTSPYTLNRMTDNLRERGNASGSNRTARATVLPRKPPIQTFTKLSGMFAGGGAGTGTLVAEPFPSRHFPSSGTGKGKSVDRRRIDSWKADEVIVLDNEDEVDVHPHIQRLTSGGSTSKPSRTESESSDDPINCLTTQSPTFRNHRRIVPPNVVDSSRPQRRPGTTSASGSNGVSSHTAKDGDATMRLRKRLKQDDPINLDDLEIQSDGTETVDNFSDDTPMPALQYRADKPPPGNVRTKIAMLEQKTPTIDLSKKQTLSKKEAMKPRSYNSSTMDGSFNKPGDVLSAPSGFGKGAGPSGRATKPVATRGRKSVTSIPPSDLFLPLEGFCWGCMHVEEEVEIAHPKWWLTWEEGGDRLVVRARAQSAKTPLDAERKHEFEPQLNNFMYTKTPYRDGSVVILSLKPKKSKINKTDGRTPFVPGSRGGEGTITFKFFSDYPDVRNGYDTLVSALKTLNKDVTPAILDIFGSRSKWVQAKGAAEAHALASASPSSRAKRSASAKQPTDISDLLKAQGRSTRSTSKLNYTWAGPDSETWAPVNTDPEPSPGPDELILVYPSSGAGALNIMKSDVKRLNPMCYLNDTLIEFGLKLWLADLKIKDPAFAEQVHVFSSFFYKKLNVKDKEKGYESVRKWTSKLDLFQKKYIVVPINENFHWYLAIICNPEYVLQPPVPKSTGPTRMTRKRKRESDLTDEQDIDVAPAPEHQVPVPPAPELDYVPETPPPPDSGGEEEVEGMLGRSALAAERGETSVNESAANAQMAELADMHLQYPASSSPSPQPMDVDDPSPSGLAVLEEPVGIVNVDDNISAAVAPSSFYGSASEGGVEDGNRVLEIEDNDNDDEGEGEGEGANAPSDPEKTTYIFIFDSLGGQHRQAGKTLAAYLALEAKDKKQLDQYRAAIPKSALVPIQPNYCDCGVYVLHFVRVFMESPEVYMQLIRSQKSRGYSADNRRADWRGGELASLRGELQQRILNLSEVWKAERVSKEEARKKEVPSVSEGQPPAVEPTVVDDSDDEVIIEEAAPPPKPQGRMRAS